MMRELEFVALGTLHHARRAQLPIGTTGIPAGFGHFSLRYCHIVTPPTLNLFQERFERFQPGVNGAGITVTSHYVPVASTDRANPLAVRLAQNSVRYSQ